MTSEDMGRYIYSTGFSTILSPGSAKGKKE
jgi:hypothetical protein